MDTDLDKLKQRIMKIIAKAESTNHPEEAASLAAKAKAMMDEHRLTLKDLDQSKDPMGRTMVHCPGNNSEFITLASGVAQFFGCSLVYTQAFHPARNKVMLAVIFVGKESARVTAELMLPYWWRSCFKEGRKAHKERGFSTNPLKAGRQVMTALAIRLLENTAPEQVNEAHAAQAELTGTKPGKALKINLTQESVSIASNIPLNMQIGG